MQSIEFLGEQRDRLGECPLWDERRQALYWIDSKRCIVHRLTPGHGAQGDERRQWALHSEIGSLALCESGRLLVALEHEIGFLDVDTGSFERLAVVTHPEPRMRLNDGRADRAGRFLVGSLKLVPTAPVGELYQVLPSGQVDVLERGVCVSNSLGFSPDGRTLYYADSLSHQIRRYDYDPATDQIISNASRWSAAMGTPFSWLCFDSTRLSCWAISAWSSNLPYRLPRSSRILSTSLIVVLRAVC